MTGVRTVECGKHLWCVWTLPRAIRPPTALFGDGTYRPSVIGTPYAAYFFFAYCQHFAYCVFLTRITYCVLRIAYDCSRSRAPPSGGPSPSDPCPSRDCQISVLEASRGRAVAASDALPSGRRPPRHSVAATATLPATDLPSRLRQLIPIPRSIHSQPCGRCPPRIIAACKGHPTYPFPALWTMSTAYHCRVQRAPQHPPSHPRGQ